MTTELPKSHSPHANLEARLAEIKTRIRQYPQPIAGCDAQYQHLYDEREAIVAAIRSLKKE